jgi:hypothetical protein
VARSAASLGDPQDAPLGLVEQLAVHSDAWRADLLDDPRADSVVARSGALLGDPQDALPVLACWLVVHSAAPLAVH